MPQYDYDLFVIGAGSGGVRAARVAAGHGAKVAIAEEHRVGGTCVIRGCVPKKLLVYGAHFAEDLKDARRFGWSVPDCAFSWAALKDNVLAEVNRLEGLYRNMLDSHDIALMGERATLSGPNRIDLAGGRSITARYILLAPGARPTRPAFDGWEHGITSNELFHIDALPRRILIVGGGYIANEFAGIFNELGTQVTVVNRSRSILRGYDADVRERLLQISLAKGIDFRFNCEIEKVQKEAGGDLLAYLSDSDVPERCDLLLFAAGRIPNSMNLGLEEAGVEVDTGGAIKVDAHNRTTCASIYAVGDVTNRVQLTPVAIREGHAVADSLFGGKTRTLSYEFIPSAVFSHPPIAAIGMTEKEARAILGSVRVFTSDFRPMKNVLADRNERALYKMIVDEETDRVVGLHMIGQDAPEILQAAAVAIRAGLTKQDFDETFALHPSMAEELLLLK